jgi:hypothetical protein
MNMNQRESGMLGEEQCAMSRPLNTSQQPKKLYQARKEAILRNFRTGCMNAMAAAPNALMADLLKIRRFENLSLVGESKLRIAHAGLIQVPVSACTGKIGEHVRILNLQQN